MSTGAKGDTFRRLAAVAFFLAPLAAAMLPRLTTVFFPLLGTVTILAAMWHGPRWKEALTPRVALIGCLVFSLYVFLNAVWAWSPGAGLAKASLLLGAIFLAVAVGAAVTALNERQSHDFAWAFAAGATLGIVYVLVEMLTGGIVTRFIFNTLPMIRPDTAKHISIDDDIVTFINLSTLNQGVTTIMLNLWPALLVLAGVASRHRNYLIVAALFAVATVIAIFASKHSSSQFALIASALVFALAWKWNRLTIRGLAAAWCLAFALVLPASFMAYDAKLHTHPSVPHSYKARIILWDYTAEKTLEHPWLGVGVNSTREMDAARIKEAQGEAQRRGGSFPRTTGHHGHSLFLQTWFELGAVGAALLALAGALVVLRMEAWPRDVQPYLAAAFTAFASIGAFAWGMWQAWWICAVGLMAAYLCLGRQFRAPQPQPPPSPDAGS